MFAAATMVLEITNFVCCRRRHRRRLVVGREILLRGFETQERPYRLLLRGTRDRPYRLRRQNGVDLLFEVHITLCLCAGGKLAKNGKPSISEAMKAYSEARN